MRTASFTPQRPPGAPAMRMRWLDLLFVHWPVAPAALAPLVPAGLDLDAFDGRAWVGLVPFSMRDVRRRGFPPLPTMHHFPECNVRTYVSRGGEPGVWFFSLDAASRLAVWGARRLWHLNYVHARIRSRRDGDAIDYAVERTATPGVTLRCAWRAGAARSAAAPGDLAHFLTERYALYAVDRRGRVHRGRIWHEPWPLREASLTRLEDRLVAAAGLEVDPTVEPVLYHADALSVEAWPLEIC